jgi:hypothetical protein
MVGQPFPASRRAGNGVTASALGTAAQWVLGLGGRIATGSLLLLVGLMALFFLLRDGDALAAQTRRFAQAQFGKFGDHFLDQTVLAIRGTVIGTIAVAIGEGVLIGGGYALAGRAARVAAGPVHDCLRDAAVRGLGGVQRRLAVPRGERRTRPRRGCCSPTALR